MDHIHIRINNIRVKTSFYYNVQCNLTQYEFNVIRENSKKAGEKK